MAGPVTVMALGRAAPALIRAAVPTRSRPRRRWSSARAMVAAPAHRPVTAVAGLVSRRATAEATAAPACRQEATVAAWTAARRAPTVVTDRDLSCSRHSFL